MKKQIAALWNSFHAGTYDKYLSGLLSLAKAIFCLSLFMCIICLALIIFSGTEYYYKIATPEILDVLLATFFYGTFYLLIFVAFPASLIVFLIYWLYSYGRREKIKIKAHIRLIVWNIIVLLLITAVVVFSRLYWR